MEVVVCLEDRDAAFIGVVTRFVTRTDVQCAETSMNTGFGERGWSRTSNLLILDQQQKTNGFNGFDLKPPLVCIIQMQRECEQDVLREARQLAPAKKKNPARKATGMAD